MERAGLSDRGVLTTGIGGSWSMTRAARGMAAQARMRMRVDERRKLGA